ncbi:hypothetical protein HZB00_02735 [Candidatus Woesearchaeota archaeon]|nr:hypothetical protein [Candidatus Woesearchaeota archaeon]
MSSSDEIKQWIKKVESIKKGEVDLSRDEDLTIGLMNLISIEEHLYFTAMKTNKEHYLEMLNSVRDLRKQLLAKIVTHPEGEEWCISKHLLAGSMRLMEVGTKELAKKKNTEAQLFFHSAFQLYSLFFAINTGMIKSKELPALSETPNKEGMLRRFSTLVKKAVDCCKE